jgi:hypothetical protein
LHNNNFWTSGKYIRGICLLAPTEFFGLEFELVFFKSQKVLPEWTGLLELVYTNQTDV